MLLIVSLRIFIFFFASVNARNSLAFVSTSFKKYVQWWRARALIMLQHLEGRKNVIFRILFPLYGFLESGIVWWPWAYFAVRLGITCKTNRKQIVLGATSYISDLTLFIKQFVRLEPSMVQKFRTYASTIFLKTFIRCFCECWNLKRAHSNDSISACISNRFPPYNFIQFNFFDFHDLLLSPEKNRSICVFFRFSDFNEMRIEWKKVRII